jgi:hypothetical protein
MIASIFAKRILPLILACNLGWGSMAATPEKDSPDVPSPAFQESVRPDASANTPPVNPPAKDKQQIKKGNKKKWIVIAAVAGGAVVAIALVNKRLGNEGAGIFR